MPDNATIDRWIAEHVMGWALRPDYGELWCIGDEPKRRCDQWSPTTNISDAMDGLKAWHSDENELCMMFPKWVMLSRDGRILAQEDATGIEDLPRAISICLYKVTGGQP